MCPGENVEQLRRMGIVGAVSFQRSQCFHLVYVSVVLSLVRNHFRLHAGKKCEEGGVPHQHDTKEVATTIQIGGPRMLSPGQQQVQAICPTSPGA